MVLLDELPVLVVEALEALPFSKTLNCQYSEG